MHGCQESKLLELHLPSTKHLNVAADDIFLLPSDNTFCCWRTPNQRRGRCGSEPRKAGRKKCWLDEVCYTHMSGLTYGPIFAKFRDVHLHAPSAPKLAEFCQDLPEQTELKVLKSSVWDTIIDSKIANQIHHLRFDPRAEAGPLSNPARLDNPT